MCTCLVSNSVYRSTYGVRCRFYSDINDFKNHERPPIANHIYFQNKKEPYYHEKSVSDETYISENRALDEYFLKKDDLKSLKHFNMRSAYSTGATVMSNYYLKADIQRIARRKYGTHSDVITAYNIFNFKKTDIESLQNDIMRSISYIRSKKKRENESSITENEQRSKFISDARLVTISLSGNLLILLMKIIGWKLTHSSVILAEIVHSLLDICTQAIRYIGISISQGKPSKKHPYGYSRALYAFSLSSAISVFIFGCVFPIYHGLLQLFINHSIQNVEIGIALMWFSGIVELVTLVLAARSISLSSRKEGISFFKYLRNSSDPTPIALFLEDSTAVCGILLAYVSLLASEALNSALPDIFGSICVGILMGCVSVFQIKNNYDILVGQSIPEEKLYNIIELLERDKLILSVNDFKATYIGKNRIRFKAEISINGRELTKLYLHNADLSLMLKDVKEIDSESQLRDFMIFNGEQITDLLGGEVNRIESNVKKKFPQVRHIDLEII